MYYGSVKLKSKTFCCVCLDQPQTIKKVKVKAITNKAYEPDETKVKLDKSNVFQNQCKICSEVQFGVNCFAFWLIELIQQACKFFGMGYKC